MIYFILYLKYTNYIYLKNVLRNTVSNLPLSLFTSDCLLNFNPSLNKIINSELYISKKVDFLTGFKVHL